MAHNSSQDPNPDPVSRFWGDFIGNRHGEFQTPDVVALAWRARYGDTDPDFVSESLFWSFVSDMHTDPNSYDHLFHGGARRIPWGWM